MVHGSAKWISGPEPDGSGLLRINGKDYDIRPILGDGETVGYLVGGYSVRLSPQESCECEYFLHKHDRKGCKHIAALKAALARSGIRHAD